MKNTTNQPTFELICDSHHGIYCPQFVMEQIRDRQLLCKNYSEIEKYFTDLSKPDNELYWDAWNDLMNKAILLDKDGNEYYIDQSEDVWAVPVGMIFEDHIN